MAPGEEKDPIGRDVLHYDQLAKLRNVSLGFTFSVGASPLRKSEGVLEGERTATSFENIEVARARADEQLYRAKAGGRNRLAIEGEEEIIKIDLKAPEYSREDLTRR